MGDPEGVAHNPCSPCIDISVCENKKQKQNKNGKNKKKNNFDNDMLEIKANDVSVDGEPSLPVDDRVSFLCELKFRGCLRQGSESRFMDVIVDTGAGFGYLIWPHALPLPTSWTFRDCAISVAMANGQVSKVDQVLPAQLEVGDGTYDVDLRVLLSSCSRPSILCGRQLIDQFGLVICGSSRLLSREGQCLFDAAVSPVPAAGATNRVRSSAEWESLDQVCAVLDNLPDARLSDMTRPPLVMEDSVLPVTSPRCEEMVNSILSKIESVGETKMLYCPSGTLKLERLAPEASRDLPDQTHQFRLSLPTPESLPARKSYSGALYARLGKTQREQFDQLVDEYVTAGWWRRVNESDPRAKHPTDVFLHKAGTPKGRLVCDFRPFNAIFSDVSSSVPLIEHVLTLMRTESFKYVFVGDCSKAFYRVALSPPLALRAGDRVFLCNRVSFGLSMGPETLRGSLGVLMDYWRSTATEPGLLSIYVDDFQLHCDSEQLINSLLLLLRRCGFAVSSKKFQTSFPLKLFGCVIDRVDNSVVATPPVVEGLESMVIDLRTSPTKRAVFELAGRVSYDPLKTLPVSRLISDLLRSISGKSKTGWDEPIVFARPEEEQLFSELLTWLLELDERCTSTSLLENETGPTWAACVDASIFGSGYALEFNQSLFQQSASAWKPTQFSYHSNRLEGLSLLSAMRSLASYLEFRRSVAFGNQPKNLPVVRVFSDSKSAIAWSNGRPPSDAKGLEYRMLTRLQEALTEEMKILAQLSSCSLTHLAGKKNVHADSLSRLLYRNMSGKTIGSVLRSDFPSEEAALVVEVPVHPVEALAREVMDYESLLERFQMLLLVWKALRPQDTARSHPVEPSDPELALVKALQSLLFNKSRYVLQDGVYHHQWNDAKGELQCRPVLPKQAEYTRRLILKYQHRLNGHRGRAYDVAFSFEKGKFFIEGVVNGCRDVIKRCLRCATARAVTVMPVPPHVEKREVNLPPFSRIAIDLTYANRRTPVFAALCLDTHLVFFYGLEDSTRQSIERAVNIPVNRYLVSLRLIRCDNAASMNDSFISKLKRSGHPDLEVSRTPVGGSVANPVERMHRELWTLVRSRRLLSLNPNELDAAAAVINHRPLATYRDGSSVIVVTPAKLAFGSSYGFNGQELAEFKQEFYERYFLLYRRRHNSGARRMLITISSYVLVSNKAAEWNRTDMLFHVGQVIAIGKGSLTIRFTSGEIRDVSTNMVAPLERYFFDENAAETAVDSPGGRVEEMSASQIPNEENTAQTPS